MDDIRDEFDEGKLAFPIKRRQEVPNYGRCIGVTSRARRPCLCTARRLINGKPYCWRHEPKIGERHS